MIIDLSYIKKVLEIDIEDSKLQYLLHHYFEDVCEKINVNTTLTEQEISDIALASTDDMPMLGYNETSLFQDTLIYGIACHLNQTNVQTTSVPQVIYNEYIDRLDLSTIPQDESGRSHIRLHPMPAQTGGLHLCTVRPRLQDTRWNTVPLRLAHFLWRQIRHQFRQRVTHLQAVNEHFQQNLRSDQYGQLRIALRTNAHHPRTPRPLSTPPSARCANRQLGLGCK